MQPQCGEQCGKLVVVSDSALSLKSWDVGAVKPWVHIPTRHPPKEAERTSLISIWTKDKMLQARMPRTEESKNVSFRERSFRRQCAFNRRDFAERRKAPPSNRLLVTLLVSAKNK